MWLKHLPHMMKMNIILITPDVIPHMIGKRKNSQDMEATKVSTQMTGKRKCSVLSDAQGNTFLA